MQTAKDHDFAPIITELEVELESSVVDHLRLLGIRQATGEDEQLIRKTVSHAEERLGSIEDSLQKLRELSAHLEEKARQTTEFINEIKCWIAPINHIFPELLSQIFIEASSYDIRSMRPPVAAYVSRHWRQIALATPQLWSNIRIVSTYHPRKPPIAQISRAKNRIKNSNDWPLTLSIDMEKFHQEVLDLIVEFATRWKAWDLLVPIIYYRRLEPFQDQFTSLESCSLLPTPHIFHDWEETPPVNDTFSFLSKAPLQSISFVTHPFNSKELDASWFDLPFERITHWKSAEVVSGRFSRLFSAPALESCFIRFTDWDGLDSPRNWGGSEVNAYKLTTLHIFCENMPTETQICLQNLPALPSLRRFFLFTETRSLLESPSHDIIPFFSRSGNQLEVLAMSLDLLPKDLGRCLDLTPKLSMLHLNRVASAERLAELTVNPNDRKPRLRQLHTLRISGKILFTPEEFSRMVLSRLPDAFQSGETNGGVDLCPLKSVWVLPDRQVESTRSSFEETRLDLLGRGVDVRVCEHDWTQFTSHEYIYSFPEGDLDTAGDV